MTISGKAFAGLGLSVMAGLVLQSAVAEAATYYVSPTGSDAAAGTSESSAWMSLAKVNGTKFSPGDRILLKRGGEWRESLSPSSSGAPDNPIVFDVYGTGEKPRLYGSVVLTSDGFTGSGPYTCVLPKPWPDDGYVYVLEDRVFLVKSSTTYDKGTGRLTIKLDSNPKTNGKLYTACVRGNVIFSNRSNHLVFRSFVVDETAGEVDDGMVQGYGIRVEGSKDVLVEDCEAHRCGRHNVGVINATGFIGRGLDCQYVAPEYPGGNTIYVSYADAGAPVKSCTSEYIDCTADHLEDGKGGMNLFFVSHGENQGKIVFENVTAQTKVSFMSGPSIVKGGTLLEGASIENWGSGLIIDGLTLKDSSAIDQWAVGGLIQNCLVDLTPTGGGPTGYGSAILCRDKANGNTIRFNTIVSKGFKAIVVHKKAQARIYGNVIVSDGTAIALSGGGEIDKGDIAQCDHNFYAGNPRFEVGSALSYDAWQKHGYDTHSLKGDAQFKDAAGGDYTLAEGAGAIDAASVEPQLVPETDRAGAPRPANGVADMGAYEADGAPPKPVIMCPASTSATRGVAFQFRVAATARPTKYAASGLPEGLRMDAATGVISGTPVKVETSRVALSATNSAGTGSKTLVLTVVEPGKKYALSVSGGSGGGSYEEGTVVKIAAGSVPGGKVFNGWTGDVDLLGSRTSASTKLNMPQRPVSLTATYREYTAPKSMGGLVGWWKLDESGVNVASDASGAKNDGKLVKLDPKSWTPADGLIGGALRFAGGHDYVDCGADPSLDVQSLTAALWINADERRNQCPIDRLPVNTGVGWAVRMRDDGAIWFRVGVEPGHGAADNYGPADSYSPGSWVHVATTFDEKTGELALYVDGAEKHRYAWKGTKLNAAGTPLLLGTTNKPGKEPFKGRLDDVRVYGRVLSNEEIMALAKGLDAPKTEGAAASVAVAAPVAAVEPVTAPIVQKPEAVVEESIEQPNEQAVETAAPAFETKEPKAPPVIAREPVASRASIWIYITLGAVIAGVATTVLVSKSRAPKKGRKR